MGRTAYGRKPIASEVLDVMDLLQRDAEWRQALGTGEGIFDACIEHGLLNQDSIDWLAEAMQELHSEGLIARGSVHGGMIEPRVWDGRWIRCTYDWRVLQLVVQTPRSIGVRVGRCRLLRVQIRVMITISLSRMLARTRRRSCVRWQMS